MPKSYNNVLVKAVIKIVTGCLRTMKVAIFAFGDFKVVLVSNVKYGTLSIYVLFKKRPSKGIFQLGSSLVIVATTLMISRS